MAAITNQSKEGPLSAHVSDSLNGRDAPAPGAVAPVAQDAALARIGEALKGLRFGTVLAVVQDGVVVQIERTEKTRIDKKMR